jgi:hypothetical protein
MQSPFDCKNKIFFGVSIKVFLCGIVGWQWTLGFLNGDKPFFFWDGKFSLILNMNRILLEDDVATVTVA